MKQVYTHENIVVVHSVKNILANNDIESYVKNDDISAMGARNGIANIFQELWILNDADYDRARELIAAEVDNPASEEPWLCAGCGEENEGSFEICWKCQEERHGS